MPITNFFSPSLLQLAVNYSAPLLIAAMGELLLERSGLLDVALEGKMAVGASVGFLVCYFSGSVILGLLAAMVVGAIFGLAFGFVSVNLRANQIISGMGFLILTTGLASLLYRLFVGIVKVTPQIDVLDEIKLPLLSQIPFLGKVLFTQSWLTYLAYLMVPAVSFILYKTPLGLRLRACGESPRALDTLGVNVFRIRLGASIVGSSLIGLAGAYLPLVFTATYTDGLVGGRGWLTLQLVIFGRYLAPLIMLGSLFFGYLESLKFSLVISMHSIPPQFFLLLPYLSALIVLVFSKGGYRPESLLKPYHREQKN